MTVATGLAAGALSFVLDFSCSLTAHWTQTQAAYTAPTKEAATLAALSAALDIFFIITTVTPCWRTLEESCKGLGSVSLKNKQQQHTQPGPCEILVGPVETEFQGRLRCSYDPRPGP